jgi:glycosyltransferase involved in cell wall biosynthesis
MAKIAIFWQSFPGYVTKCVEELAANDKVEIIAHYLGVGTSNNYIDRLKRHGNINIITGTGQGAEVDPRDIIKSFIAFHPDMALIALARFGLYARLARELKKLGALVVGVCDHFWKGTWKDYATMAATRLGIYSGYEAILVPGVLGRIYARKLRFKQKSIFEGLYTCDTNLFQPVGLKRHQDSQAQWPPVFLFVGEISRRKGIDTLLEAYSRYRRTVVSPWELWIVGKGELEPLTRKVKGVKNLGFKNPQEVAEIMGQAGCLVIPSRMDHWPLIIHEATCAGLPILATQTCGSSVELIQNGYNGYTFPPDDPLTLSDLMKYISENGSVEAMGAHSLQMSCRYSTQLWAKRILVDIPYILRGQPLIDMKNYSTSGKSF